MLGILTPQDIQKRYKNIEVQSLNELHRDIYREAARGRAERGICGEIFNDSFGDSIDIYETIFDFSNERVRIIARGIRDRILSQVPVIRACSDFLKREGTSLQMDLRAYSDVDITRMQNSDFIKNIINLANEDNSLTRGKTKLSFYRGGRLGWLPEMGSVTFGDERMYRYRHKQAEANFSANGNATVDFNNPGRVAEYEARADNALQQEELMRDPITI